MSSLEKFVLDLETLSWAIVATDGQIRQSADHDSADSLSTISEGKEVIVLVSALDVFVTTCELPKMSTNRLRHAIPFALEDQLIDDVDQLHFAFSLQKESSSVLVSVVAREKMQSWLETLQNLNLRVDKIIPRQLLLPSVPPLSAREEEGAVCYSMVKDDYLLVHDNQGHCFGCDEKNIGLYLAHNPPNTSIVIANYTETALASSLPQSDCVSEEFFPASQLICDLATAVSAGARINLLQGAFASKSTQSGFQRNFWKISGSLACVWLALLMVYPLGSYFILKGRAASIEHAIADIYREQFPNATAIVAPKLRMAEKLNRLKSQSGQDNFLMLLASISKVIDEQHPIRLRRLDFQNNQLHLRIEANSSDAVSSFTNALVRQGLTVKQQNATLSGNKIHAALQIG